ncbi:carbon-nitrogen hydrolase [Planctomycetota bacterium]|nr:carbon-nitrogen family hydrolase [Planctomycetota bacterium]GDY01476.1 carbon-nitrogen hydrolase [Planctomycetota bacterium]
MAIDPDDDSFVTACVQFDVRRGDVDANIRAAEKGIAEAAAKGARVCVLPEMWSTSFAQRYTQTLLAAAAAAETKLIGLSTRHQMMIVGSSAEASEGGVYNTARVYDRGVTLGAYRKIHLFSPHSEPRYFLAGDTPLVLDTAIGRIGVMICYDLRFPELARYYFNKGVEILLVPAQWAEVRSQHWRSFLRARAIENEMFVIGCNRTGQEDNLKKGGDILTYTGDGRIVDPTGEILTNNAADSHTLLARIEPRMVRTMRRILPINRDQRPNLYRKLFEETWDSVRLASRELTLKDPSLKDPV